jgi:rare lipoprotein A
MGNWLQIVQVIVTILHPVQGSYYGLNSLDTSVSYYGEPFNGRRTASGEVFNMNALTCASPRLPFNSIVIFEYNGTVLAIRVNDRGPYRTNDDGSAVIPLEPHPIRKFDLSKLAFKRLVGNLGVGVAKVKILYILEV